MVYTSGTSGTPKGVLHAQRAVWGRRPMYRDWYGMTPDDVLLHTGAFNWTYTLGTGLFDPWANGASSIVYTGPRDRSIWLRLIGELQPTIMASVPALIPADAG
jgi:acyl-coenzyme A synthetase/AMP-(fatty) acid ligase